VSSNLPPTDAGLGTDDTEVGAAPSVTARSPFRAGLELGGRYRLIAQIGRGGMGEVWEAEHTTLKRTVAIKLVLPDAADRELPARLQREAELAARLEHPNIVSVTDFGLVGPRQPFVVMERLSGRPLSALLRERGSLPWTQARDIAVQVAAGLACAHRADIVHRDLKPSNIFVLDDPHGHLRIKIIDFGLAKATQLGPGERALTKSGAVFGTPGYMSPEQIRGESLDGRADLYSLGVVLFEMIVGASPWKRGPMVQLLYSQLFEQAPTMRSRTLEVPADLDSLVARCLCKDRTMRPADADAMRLELVGAGTGKGLTLVPDEVIPLPPPDVRARFEAPLPAATPRRRWLAPVGFAAIALVAGVVTLQVVPRLRKADAPPLPDPTTVEAEPVDVAPLREPSVGTPIADPPAQPIAREPTPAIVEPPPTPEPTPTAPPIEAPNTKPSPKPTKSKPRETPPVVTPDPEQPKAEPPQVPKRKGDILGWPTSKPRPPADEPREPAPDGSGAG
jgi:eukaryotic-like serine/threonine-protein kinase